MSTEIIIIIIGAFLVLIGLIPKLKSQVRVPSAIIGILLIIYGGYTYGTVNMPGQIEQVESGNVLKVTYPVERVQVISPVPGDVVKCRILTMGVYPEDHNKDIWVLLKPSDGYYYPQSDHTNTSYKMNGEWQVITRFGGDKGELYELIVFETDAAATQFFSNTIQEWKDANSYTGLTQDQIPEGATEIERLSVSLLDNCRGIH